MIGNSPKVSLGKRVTRAVFEVDLECLGSISVRETNGCDELPGLVPPGRFHHSGVVLFQPGFEIPGQPHVSSVVDSQALQEIYICAFHAVVLSLELEVGPPCEARLRAEQGKRY